MNFLTPQICQIVKRSSNVNRDDQVAIITLQKTSFKPMDIIQEIGVIERKVRYTSLRGTPSSTPILSPTVFSEIKVIELKAFGDDQNGRFRRFLEFAVFDIRHWNIGRKFIRYTPSRGYKCCLSAKNLPQMTRIRRNDYLLPRLT